MTNRATLLRTAIALFSLSALPFAANAADVPVKGYYKNTPRSVIAYTNWTGFYVGLNGGLGQSKVSWSANGATVNPNGSGWLLGGTVGYNYQLGSWVFGIEGDWDWANIKGNTPCINPAFTCTATVNSLATVRGRVGYAWNSLLLYGTAGWAMAGVKTDTAGPSSSSDSHTTTGLVYGAGLEYAFLGNWSAKIEYLRADLGTKQFTNVSPEDIHPQLSVIRAGVNYKFNGPLFSRF